MYPIIAYQCTFVNKILLRTDKYFRGVDILHTFSYILYTHSGHFLDFIISIDFH